MTWPTTLLGEVVDVLDSRRKPITKSERRAGPYPYYGATGVVDWVDGFLFDESLVLIGEDGAKWGAGDQSSFRIEGKTWVNNHAHVLRPRREIILDDWLVFFLNSADLSDYVSGMTVPKLNQGSLRQIEIPLPPLEEQKRIVAKLDQAFAALDRARASVAANWADAYELFQRTLSAAFDDDNALGVEMRSLFDIGSSKRVLKAQWVTQGVPFYRGREVTALSRNGSVDNQLFITEEHFAELKERYGVPTPGDIIITAIGTIGNAYIVQEWDRFYFKDASVLWLKKICDVSSEYVLAWLRSPRFFEQLDTGNGATVDTLTIQKMQSIKIPLPTFAEQERIVATLDAVRTDVEKLKSTYERQLTDIAALRQSVLQTAFSGQLT